MLNNGVHWISDYPLAVYIGYKFGKIVTSKKKKHINEDTEKTPKAFENFRFTPVLSENTDPGIGFTFEF